MQPYRGKIVRHVYSKTENWKVETDKLIDWWNKTCFFIFEYKMQLSWFKLYEHTYNYTEFYKISEKVNLLTLNLVKVDSSYNRYFVTDLSKHSN